MVEKVGIGLRIGCALLAWLFCARYGMLRWNRTEEGRHLMGYTLITAIFMTLASIVTIWGPFPGIAIVGVILYFWLLYLLVRRNYLLFKRQRELQNKRNVELRLIKEGQLPHASRHKGE